MSIGTPQSEWCFRVSERNLSAEGTLSDVVRVGDTVRRPVGPWTPSVHALLEHLEAAGFDGAPRVFGIDEQGPFIWDVAYMAIGLIPITPDAAGLGWPDAVPTDDRLNALADGYGLSPKDRARFAPAITARIRSSYEHGSRRAEAGEEPWDRMWREGHGDGWLGMLRVAEANEGRWADALTRPR